MRGKLELVILRCEKRSIHNFITRLLTLDLSLNYSRYGKQNLLQACLGMVAIVAHHPNIPIQPKSLQPKSLDLALTFPPPLLPSRCIYPFCPYKLGW